MLTRAKQLTSRFDVAQAPKCPGNDNIPSESPCERWLDFVEATVVTLQKTERFMDGSRVAEHINGWGGANHTEEANVITVERTQPLRLLRFILRECDALAPPTARG